MLIGISVVMAFLVVPSEATGTQEASQEENTEVLQPDTYVAPDPCGLSTVVCEGEQTKLTTVTAYTSYANQTDSSPCISADGSNICDRYATGVLICATNDYAIGAILSVPGYGDCVVADRMNSRYTGTGRVDIYMGYDTPAALQWGVRQVEITEL